MKFNSFSIVVGTAACNANCPFCVSKMTGHAAGRVDVRWQRFDIACRLAQQSGVNTVLLTGKGEPTLWPDLILEYLQKLAHYDMPIVELQTNGIVLAKSPVRQWSANGLSLVCISITHYNPAQSNLLMGITEPTYNFWRAVDMLHNCGLSVRLNCTMLRSGLWASGHLERLLEISRRYRVEQVTLRDVTVPSRSVDETLAEYARSEHAAAAPILREYLEGKGAVTLLHLPHGAIVYDYNGQNVCINNCLTSTTDPDAIRQLIFFHDGRLAYDWSYPAARVL